MSRAKQFRPLIAAVLIYIFFWLTIPRFSLYNILIRAGVENVGPYLLLDVLLATTVFMAAQILIIRYVCSLQIKFATGGIAFLISLALFSALLVARVAWKAPIFVSLPLDLSRIAAATFLGYIVSFALRDRNIVLPIAIFAAFLDIWTVAWGPTRHFVEKAPEVVQQVSAAIPMPGGRGEPMSVIGPADFVFLAVFFGAIYRLNMEPRRTFWFLVPLLAAAMVAVIVLPHFVVGLPGLVPMSIGVIAANYRHFKLQRQELISVILISLVLALSLAAYLLHRAAHVG